MLARRDARCLDRPKQASRLTIGRGSSVVEKPSPFRYTHSDSLFHSRDAQHRPSRRPCSFSADGEDDGGARGGIQLDQIGGWRRLNGLRGAA